MNKEIFRNSLFIVLILVTFFGYRTVSAQTVSESSLKYAPAVFNGEAYYRHGSTPEKDIIEFSGNIIFNKPENDNKISITTLRNKVINLYLYDKDRAIKSNIAATSVSISQDQLTQYDTPIPIKATFYAQSFGFNNLVIKNFNNTQAPFTVKMSIFVLNGQEYQEFSKEIPVSKESTSPTIFPPSTPTNNYSGSPSVYPSTTSGTQVNTNVPVSATNNTNDNPFLTKNTQLNMEVQIKKNQDRYDVSGLFQYRWPEPTSSFPISGISPGLVITLVPADSAIKNTIDKTTILSPVGDFSNPSKITYEFKSWYTSQTPIKEIIIEDPILQVREKFTTSTTILQKKSFSKTYPTSSYKNVPNNFSDTSEDNSQYGSENIKIRGVLKNPLPFNTIPEVVNAFVKGIVIPIAIPLLGIAIMYTGFLFVQARGNETKLKEAKLALKWTLIGGAIILASYVIAEGLQATIKDIMKPQ